MKMNWTFEEMQGLAEDAEELLEKKIESLITQHETSLTLEQMISVRNEVFYNSYRSFIDTLEEGHYTYDFHQIGRFSHLLYQQLESVWLEYTR